MMYIECITFICTLISMHEYRCQQMEHLQLKDIFGQPEFDMQKFGNTLATVIKNEFTECFKPHLN